MKTTLKLSLLLLATIFLSTSLHANEREDLIFEEQEHQELRGAEHTEQEARREEKRAAQREEKIEKHKERIRTRMEAKGRSYEEIEAHLAHLFGEA